MKIDDNISSSGYKKAWTQCFILWLLFPNVPFTVVMCLPSCQMCPLPASYAFYTMYTLPTFRTFFFLICIAQNLVPFFFPNGSLPTHMPSFCINEHVCRLLCIPLHKYSLYQPLEHPFSQRCPVSAAFIPNVTSTGLICRILDVPCGSFMDSLYVPIHTHSTPFKIYIIWQMVVDIN